MLEHLYLLPCLHFSLQPIVALGFPFISLSLYYFCVYCFVVGLILLLLILLQFLEFYFHLFPALCQVISSWFFCLFVFPITVDIPYCFILVSECCFGFLLCRGNCFMKFVNLWQKRSSTISISFRGSCHLFFCIAFLFFPYIIFVE